VAKERPPAGLEEHRCGEQRCGATLSLTLQPTPIAPSLSHKPAYKTPFFTEEWGKSTDIGEEKEEKKFCE